MTNIRKQACVAQALLAAAYCAFGCSGEGNMVMAVGDEPIEIDSLDNELYLNAETWPNGVVPVCFSSTSAARPNFATESGIIRYAAQNSWGAVANIEFTGWGTCSGSTAGKVKVTLADSGTSQCRLGYPGSDATRDLKFDVSSGNWGIGTGLVAHEFGHCLGFAHEHERADFVDQGGQCQSPVDLTEGDDLGTPPDIESIMASTSYCQQNANLSSWDAVGARVAYGTRADNVVSSTSTLYARKRSDGDFYRLSSGSWSKVGAPGTEFVTVGSTLYGLRPNLGFVTQYSGSGTSWSTVGSAAGRILRCGSNLCATNPSTKVLYRYNGSSWSQIGSAAAGYASTSSTLYSLSLDRSKVQKYSGSGTSWSTIANVDASAIYATTTDVFYTDAIDGDLYRYSGSGTTWSKIGGPGRHFVGVGSTLYGLSPERSSVWKYSGSGTAWTQVGNSADWIYGGESGSLYAVDPTSKNIYRYSGSGFSWIDEGEP